jgi:hypothetical protein
MLGVGDVPAGHYTQVRLHLTDGSNVVVDGAPHPLKVPSGMQSGYKLVGEFDVPAGGQVELTLDFDAARSVVLTGNGRYMLKPTCRVIVNPVDTIGSIMGTCFPRSRGDHLRGGQCRDAPDHHPGADGRFTLANLLAGTSGADPPGHEPDTRWTASWSPQDRPPTWRRAAQALASDPGGLTGVTQPHAPRCATRPRSWCYPGRLRHHLSSPRCS